MKNQKEEDDFILQLEKESGYDADAIGVRRTTEKERTQKRLMSLKSRRRKKLITEQPDGEEEEEEEENDLDYEQTTESYRPTSISNLRSKFKRVNTTHFPGEEDTKPKLIFADDKKGESELEKLSSIIVDRLEMMHELIRWDPKRDDIAIDEAFKEEPIIQQSVKEYAKNDFRKLMQEPIIEKCVKEEAYKKYMKEEEPLIDKSIEPLSMPEPVPEAESEVVEEEKIIDKPIKDSVEEEKNINKPIDEEKIIDEPVKSPVEEEYIIDEPIKEEKIIDEPFEEEKKEETKNDSNTENDKPLIKKEQKNKEQKEKDLSKREKKIKHKEEEKKIDTSLKNKTQKQLANTPIKKPTTTQTKRVPSIPTRIVKKVVFDSNTNNNRDSLYKKTQHNSHSAIKAKTDDYQTLKPVKSLGSSVRNKKMHIKTKEDFFERQKDFLLKVDAKKKKLIEEIKLKESPEIIPLSNKKTTKEAKEQIIKSQLCGFDNWEKKRVEKIGALQKAKKIKEENEIKKNKKYQNRSVEYDRDDITEVFDRLYVKDITKRKELGSALQKAYKPSFKPTINQYVTNVPQSHSTIKKETLNTTAKNLTRNVRRGNEGITISYFEADAEEDEDQLIRGKLLNKFKKKRKEMNLSQPRILEGQGQEYSNFFTNCDIRNHTEINDY